MLTLDGSFQWLHLEPNFLTGMSCHCLMDQLADHIKMCAKSCAGWLFGGHALHFILKKQRWRDSPHSMWCVRTVRALRPAFLTSSPIDRFQASSSHGCEGMEIIHGVQASHIYDIWLFTSCIHFIYLLTVYGNNEWLTWPMRKHIINVWSLGSMYYLQAFTLTKY